MQQRRENTPMENGSETKSRARVLTRSHAIREETSPPREPSPNNLISPNIKVILSSGNSPTHLSPRDRVVLSPSLSRVNSPCRSPVCHSPTSTSTLVASPISQELEADNESSSKCHNKIIKQTIEGDTKRDTSHTNKKINCVCSIQNNNDRTNNNNNVPNSNALTVNRVSSRAKLRQQSSSQGSFESYHSLTRDNSMEPIDLEQFFKETVNKNAKDRLFMLKLETSLVELINRCKKLDKEKEYDPEDYTLRFPPMSSYQRMLVHRSAVYFGMDHNIDTTGKAVVVNVTSSTIIPEKRFSMFIKKDVVFNEDQPHRHILKRDSDSIEDHGVISPERQNSFENRRSKSIEERTEEYAKARKRIFDKEMCGSIGHMDCSAEDYQWSEIPWSSTDSDTSSKFRLQLPDHNQRVSGKLMKVLSEEAGEIARPHVAKSYSFGGYGGASPLNRGDSVVSTHSAGARLITKQGSDQVSVHESCEITHNISDSAASSMSWRLSPSSSGYKSQSQMSESITPSPSSTPHPPIDISGRKDSNCSDNEQGMHWVTTDIQKELVLINPTTGEPLKNEDGSLYYYDPKNPPSLSSKPPLSPKKVSPHRKERSQSPKKRSSKYSSPSHRLHVTNTATSPTMPYSSPPPQQNRAVQYIPPMPDNVPPQPYPFYGSQGFQPGPEGIPMYQQQQCLVYPSPYGIPSHFDGRIEPQPISEMSGGAYYAPENVTPAPQQITYQQPQTQYWSQPSFTYYHNPQTPASPASQRVPYAIPSQNQTNYVPPFPPPTYLPPPNQGPPNTDLVPVYSPQIVYQSNQNSPLMYQTQPSMFYTQNSVYTNPMYQPQYPQNTATPNNCNSHSTFPIHDQFPPNVMQLAQNMAQMNLGPPSHHNFIYNKMAPSHYDIRQKTCTPKGNKFNAHKNFVLNSSQSSTGTNSPAATVIAGYCPQNSGMYRTPPETPPHFNYGPGFSVPPVLFRQMSNIRANTPATTRSSRSPTPASDISHFDRQKISLPPTLLHGMSYVLQSDRIIPGRGQTNAYRNSTSLKQQQDSNKKPRKSKGNKHTNLPPNGKPV